MTPLEIEESKLTGNIDSYAAWNNEIHKELKMKYYEEDNENRIDNGALTKQLNEDYNSRAFPVRYPKGQTPEELLKQEKILHEIELRNKTPMVINRTAPEIATKYKSDILTKQNEKVMEQAKKDLKVETEQENLEKVIEDDIEGKAPPPKSNTTPATSPNKNKSVPKSPTPTLAETVLSDDDISRYSDDTFNTTNQTFSEILTALTNKNSKFTYILKDSKHNFSFSEDGTIKDYNNPTNTKRGFSEFTLNDSNN